MTVWPNGTKTRPDITSVFGYSEEYGSKFHGGTDFINFDYNCAVEDGVVVFAGWSDIGDGGGGLEIRIMHDGWTSRQLHNDALLVGVGWKVTEGQRVGIQGTSAYRQFRQVGKHCHQECLLNHVITNKLNPVEFIQNRITASAGEKPAVIDPEEEEEMPSLVRIIHDQGPESAPGFASSAVYNETIGWIKTSSGKGPRGALEYYTAIAGVLGFKVTEVHVNADGWIMAQAFKVLVAAEVAASPFDIEKLAQKLAASLGKEFVDLTADEIANELAERLKS